MLIIGVNKKYLRNILTVLAVILTAFALPTATQAGADVSHYSYTEGHAWAVFLPVNNSDECIYTFVSVEAWDTIINSEASSRVLLTLNSYDFCTDTSVNAEGDAQVPADDFKIDKKLTSASLNTTIEVYDFSLDSSYPVDISINWECLGDIPSGKSHYHNQGAGYHSNQRITSRDCSNAEASGTVSGWLPELTEFYNASMWYSSDVAVYINKQ